MAASFRNYILRCIKAAVNYPVDQQELVRRLAKFDVDIHELMELHQKIKAEAAEIPENNHIAQIWADIGKTILVKGGNYKAVESAMFMAHLYDRENFDYIDLLIEALSYNEKYNEAVEFLQKLYGVAGSENIGRFWDRLVAVLPISRLMIYVRTFKENPLEEFVNEQQLDANNFMTWLTLGYTLRFHNQPILANQALDNALALKYFG